jgi:hypothetical protein
MQSLSACLSRPQRFEGPFDLLQRIEGEPVGLDVAEPLTVRKLPAVEDEGTRGCSQYDGTRSCAFAVLLTDIAITRSTTPTRDPPRSE